MKQQWRDIRHFLTLESLVILKCNHSTERYTVHYFPECGTVRYAVQGGPGFVDEMICSNESYYEQYFSVVLFIMLT